MVIQYYKQFKGFGIYNGKTLVKAIISNCFVFRQFEGLNYDDPKIGPSPDSFHFPHPTVSKDQADPVYVKNSYAANVCASLRKSWIVLSTCCSSKYTYLEVVPNCKEHSCIGI